MSELRILIADDDKVDRIAVRRALRAAGFDAQVEEAESYAEAAARLAERTYDAAFLDYYLPDGNAHALVSAARARGVRAPIIVLTGQGDERTAVEIMKAGASDYLPKADASPERLQHALRNALRVHRAEEQARAAETERSRALSQERAARDDAEAAQRRLSFLAEASARVSSSLEYEETLENVARLAVPSIADWCFLDLAEEGGAFRRVAVAHKDPAKAHIAARFRRRFDGMADAQQGVSRVIATGQSEVMSPTPDWVLMALARDAEHLELMRSLHPASRMTVPLVARGRTLGAMTLLARDLVYTPEDLAFAEEIARRGALAVDNARLFDEVKRAEGRLREQLDFTSAIAGSLAEGVCALDADGRFTFVNPAAERMLGYGSGDLRGRPFEAMLLADAALYRPLLDALATGAVVRLDDASFRRADSTTLPVSVVASPIRSGTRVTGVVLAFHDITARKRAEAELEASRRQVAQSEKLSALGTLVSGVAHELRTPLTYLANNLFLMQARLDLAVKQDPALASIAKEVRVYHDAALEGVDRINALVKDLRPFATSEGGRRVKAGLHDVVAVAVDLFRATQRGRVEVDADLQPTSPVLLDRGQVQRVVINLLVNAAEAMPQGGRIWIRTSDAGGAACIEVEDEGAGIPPEVERRIFDPFFTTKAEGTGLGLAITRRIVEAHGGEIVYRTRLGRGTAFTIRLPVAAGPQAAGHAPLLQGAP